VAKFLKDQSFSMIVFSRSASRRLSQGEGPASALAGPGPSAERSPHGRQGKNCRARCRGRSSSTQRGFESEHPAGPPSPFLAQGIKANGQAVYYVRTAAPIGVLGPRRRWGSNNFAPQKLGQCRQTPGRAWIRSVSNRGPDDRVSRDRQLSNRRQPFAYPRPDGFSPATAKPPAVGKQGYSPLIQLAGRPPRDERSQSERQTGPGPSRVHQQPNSRT